MINQGTLDELTAWYPLPGELPPELHLALTDQAQPLQMSRGQLLFDAGKPCPDCVLVTAGSVRVAKQDGNGREILLYHVRAGETCALMLSCLLADTVYTACAVVESDLSGVSVPRAPFLHMVNESPPFRLFVLSQLSERLTALVELVEEVAFGTLDKRLAATLLSKGPTLRITHQRLADELGSSREVISRILEDFEQRGVVALGRGNIRIVDIRRLHLLAGICDKSHRHEHENLV